MPILDYQVETCRTITLAQVFDCTTGRNVNIKLFRGPFHRVRATWWGKRHSRPANRKLLGV